MFPLEIKNLRKEFPKKKGTYVAVDNLSFHIGKGEILGLLGANGAGKSTTIFMLLGVLGPSSGSISFFGKDLQSHKSEIMQRVGYVSGYARLPWNLTIQENLSWSARLFGLGRKASAERMQALLERFGLWEERAKRFGCLSAGQVTRGMLTKAFMHKPDLALLDEPTASLDPEVAHEVRRFVLAERAQRGVSMLYTSHNMDEVTAVCDRVIFLQKGKILAEGTPRELARMASLTRLTIEVSREIERATRAATSLSADIEVTGPATFSCTVGHEQVGPMLSMLGAAGVELREVDIHKPTLEDYFIRIAKGVQ